jgi:uncharacterized protein (TIGR00645 family)
VRRFRQDRHLAPVFGPAYGNLQRLQRRTAPMKSLELLVEKIILSSRWLLVVFYLGLVAALAVYALSFMFKFWKVAKEVFTLSEAEMILAMLGLIDAALVASLIVMVMISGYENFVSRFDETEADVSFLGKLDAGSLKIKVASSIVAISSIHLLQIFLNANQYSDTTLMWYTIIHLTFVVSAVMLGWLEKIMATTKAHKHETKL